MNKTYLIFGLAILVLVILFSGKEKKDPEAQVAKPMVSVSNEVVLPRGPSEVIERFPEVIPDPRVYPPRNGIASQYSNPNISIRDMHPVLAYQYAHSKGINPANLGDPIRVHNIGGGSMGLYGEPSAFTDALSFSRGSVGSGLGPKGRDEDLIAGPGNNAMDTRDGSGYARRREAYTADEGPYPGKPQNVPVPAGTMKMSNERYNPDMFRFSPLAVGTIGSAVPGFSREVNGVPLPGGGAAAAWAAPPPPSNTGGYHLPYSGAMPQVTAPGADFPPQTRPLASGDFFRPYGPNVPVANVPFFGSVNSYAPFPEINTPWEKSGILTSLHGKEQILNLYRRPIAPLQDLWEYQVQDKNGFVIKLHTTYIQNGDIIPHVTGKDGAWKVHDYVQNKYIWV
jgi:hypothetical protein